MQDHPDCIFAGLATSVEPKTGNALISLLVGSLQIRLSPLNAKVETVGHSYGGIVAYQLDYDGAHLSFEGASAISCLARCHKSSVIESELRSRWIRR